MSPNTDDDVVVTLKDIEVHFKQDVGMVERFFSDPDDVKAVDGVTLEITENQVVALVGESGCGKTTLGKTAVAAQEPTSGSVEYRGEDIWEAKRSRNSEISFSEIRRSLQIIHQDPGSSLNPNQSVLQIISDPLKKWQDLDANDRRATVTGMLETVGMTPADDYANRFPHQLSGGEQQRVALIRALLMNPDLILADEAISALDVGLRIEMMDLFLELQNQFRTSFLFISHDLANAWYLTHKADGLIGIMYLGELVEIGAPEQILNDPQHPYTKALIWATPELYEDDSEDEMPLRGIDIPDPVNPPAGCRFHTRCPEAREVCTGSNPDQVELEDDHLAACYRAQEDHEYWDSRPLTERDHSEVEEFETDTTDESTA